MAKYLQLKLFLILLILLILDLIAIKLMTVSSDPMAMQYHLERVLSTPIQLLDLKSYDTRKYLIYLNPKTQHIDLAIYQTNRLLPHRYNLEDIHEATPNAYISPCQLHQTDTTLVVWGENINLSAQSMIVKINNEVFIEQLEGERYFLKIYPHQLSDEFSLKFLDINGQNLNSKFLNVEITY